jgi:extracellular factor (EF) 3-hydroxypalmitic acid methyl ester biosynthesis protein
VITEIDIAERLAPAMQAFKDNHTSEAIDIARAALTKMRTDAGEDWAAVIKLLRQTELFQLSQLCPFTSHSFQKPRGYAGDALLLDWIYRDYRVNTSPEAGTVNALVYRNTCSSPPATAVRWRKQHLASLIDDTAFVTPHARVLSLACGHLREADVSVAVKQGLIKELVALDQDAQSLSEVQLAYVAQGMPVTPVLANIRDVIIGKHKLHDFDLIYSAGLYDYLDDKVAKKLTAILFNALKPGGRIILTNFLYGTSDTGWTQAMMDWFLIYRDQADIEAFADDIPKDQISRLHNYQCPTRSIGYVSIRKKLGP